MNYWYTIQKVTAAHTAFTTRDAALSWLELRNLTIDEYLPDPGTHSYQRINGEYKTVMHINPASFEPIHAERYIYHLSNGDYTLGKLRTIAGIVEIHYYNPNHRDRIVYPYQRTRRLIDAGIWDADPNHTGRLGHNPYGYYDLKDDAIPLETWKAKKEQGYTSKTSDGRPAILTMDPDTGATILKPVKVR